MTDSVSNKEFLSATEFGKPDVVRLAIAGGIDVNLRDDDGNTALILASARHLGHKVTFDIVRQLLAVPGVDVNAKGQNGATALITAVKGICDIEVVKDLLAAGAECNIRDGFGNTALHWVSGNKPEVVRLLHEVGADMNAQNVRACTPLMNMMRHTHLFRYADAARDMIDCGANILLENEDGETALDILLARQGHDPGLAEFMKDEYQKQLKGAADAIASAENREILKKTPVKFRFKP